MALTRRYLPNWSPADNAITVMDFSFLLPKGVGIVPSAPDYGYPGQPTPRLEIWTNNAAPVLRGGWNAATGGLVYSSDWFMKGSDGQAGTGVAVRNRTVFAWVDGGAPGTDYQFRWIVIDTGGNRWTRTGLVLVALTS